MAGNDDEPEDKFQDVAVVILAMLAALVAGILGAALILSILFQNV